MPEHVRVDRRAQRGRIAGAGEQLAKGCRGHRRAALGDKNIRCVPLLSGQSLNKFSCLSSITYAELSVDWKITDSIETFSNTVTENTCITTVRSNANEPRRSI